MRKITRKDEKSLLRRFGLKPTRGSGNTESEPEDGKSEHFLAQAKSTLKESISLKKQDVYDLTYHAGIEHRIPVFLVQMNDIAMICVRREFLQEFLEYGHELTGDCAE